jgi:hyperosmotically inducible protein
MPLSGEHQGEVQDVAVGPRSGAARRTLIRGPFRRAGNKPRRRLFRRWADCGPTKPPATGEKFMVRRERATMVSAAIAATVLLMSGCAPMQGRETAGEYVDDATVSTKVRAELVGAQSLKGLDIHVETMQDVVQLSGFVDSPAQKAQAEQIARGVKGVRDVRNNIVLRGNG